MGKKGDMRDRRTPEKEKSPKKDVKKGKGSKEEKKAQQKPGKIKKMKNKSVVTDVESKNEIGSLFTRQWPEMKHIFQSKNLQQYVDTSQQGFVSEKLDGSNVAVTSYGVIASRKCSIV